MSSRKNKDSSDFFAPIIGPIDLNTKKGYKLKIPTDQLGSIIKEVRREDELYEDAKWRVLRKLSNIIYSSTGIPTIATNSGVVSLARVNESTFPFDPQKKLEINIFDQEEKILDESEKADFIRGIIRKQLSSLSIFYQASTYFMEEKSLLRKEELELKIFYGFKVQVFSFDTKFYLTILDAYKLSLFPPLNQLIKKFGSTMFEEAEVNTVREYHKFGPVYAGKIVKIITYDKYDYQRKLNSIIDYYKKKKPRVFHEFIEHKIEEDKKQPIVVTKKKEAGRELYYLSSILVLTPKLDQISKIICEHWGERFIDYIHREMHPIPGKYLKLIEKWGHVLKNELDNSEFIEGNYDYIKFEVNFNV